MGRIQDLEDDFDRVENIYQGVIDSKQNTIEDQRDLWNQMESNLRIMSNQEIHQLYREEGIPQEAARKWEEMVDAKLKGINERPYFENLPDEERPSEMYAGNGSTTRRDLLKYLGLGAAGAGGILGAAADYFNVLEDDHDFRGGWSPLDDENDFDLFGALEDNGDRQNGGGPTDGTDTPEPTPTETPTQTPGTARPSETDFEKVTGYLNAEGVSDGYFENEDAIHNLGLKMMQGCGHDLFNFGQTISREAETGEFGENYRLHHWEIDLEDVEDEEISSMLDSTDQHGVFYLSDTGGNVPGGAYLATEQNTYERIKQAREDINEQLDEDSDYLNLDEVTSICG